MIEVSCSSLLYEPFLERFDRYDLRNHPQAHIIELFDHGQEIGSSLVLGGGACPILMQAL